MWIYYTTVASDISQVEPALAYQGPVRPYTFPARPGSMGFKTLEDASTVGTRQARREVDWLTGVPLGTLRALPDPGALTASAQVTGQELKALVQAAAAMRAPDLVRCLRSHSGGIEAAEVGDHSLGALAEDLDAGGGLLLRKAERFNGPLNRLTASLTVAHAAPSEAMVLVGSLVAPDPLPAATRWHVITLDPGTVIRLAGEAPFELDAGMVLSTDQPPQVHAHPRCATLLLAEHHFAAADRRSVLLERALFHPVLRMDAPLNVFEPIELFGRPGKTSLLERFDSELQSLIAATDQADGAWWWLLRQPLAPASLEHVVSPPAWVRGRFPGGMGVLEATENHLVAVAAGQQVWMSNDLLPFVIELLERGPVDIGTDGPRRDAALILLRAGLIEPAEPQHEV